MGREGEVVERLVPEFERRTGVRVRVQQIPWSAAHEKLLTAYVGRVMPDVLQVGNTWIPELVALGAIEPLDGRMARSAEVQAREYFPGILDTNVIDGATYGVPWYVDTRLFFYRRDLLRAVGVTRPPDTWEGWLDAMARLGARAPGERYALLLPITEWQAPVILALQHDAALLRDGERYGNFRSPAFRAAFAFYLDLFARGFAPRAGEAQVANLYQDFAAGYFAILLSGPWSIGELARRLPAALADDWATAPLPSRAGGEPGVSLAGGASLVLARGSPRAETAWRWIEYLAEPAQQVEFHRLTGDLPGRLRAWEDAALRDDPRADAFWRQLQRLRATPKIPEWERIASKIGDYAEAAIRGRLDLDATLAALDADVDALLAKRRWLLERGGAATAGAAP
jgi:multiple sugar transport system substrate-binding protein